MVYQLSYGSYNFPPDAVSFRIVQTPVYGQTGRENYYDIRWYLWGRVNGNNNTEVVAAIEELVANIYPGRDLVFSSYHQLLSASCINGTQILAFNYERGTDGVRGSGAELVLRRTFTMEIGGRQIVTADTDLYAYQETIQGIGTGGPIVNPVRSLTGAVQAQQTVLHTEYWARQSGFAVGVTTWPAASTPVWQATPNVWYPPEKQFVSLESPRIVGVNANSQFVTRWNYLSWANFPLVASPLPPL